MLLLMGFVGSCIHLSVVLVSWTLAVNDPPPCHLLYSFHTHIHTHMCIRWTIIDGRAHSRNSIVNCLFSVFPNYFKVVLQNNFCFLKVRFMPQSTVIQKVYTLCLDTPCMHPYIDVMCSISAIVRPATNTGCTEGMEVHCQSNKGETCFWVSGCFHSLPTCLQLAENRWCDTLCCPKCSKAESEEASFLTSYAFKWRW